MKSHRTSHVFKNSVPGTFPEAFLDNRQMALTETAPSRSDTLSTVRHEVHHPSGLNVILLVYNTALASITNSYNFVYEL